MAFHVVRATPTMRLPRYFWELSPSQDWPQELRQMWEACCAAHHALVVLEELKAGRGMMRSLMVDRLIDHATQFWMENEAYARPFVEALGQ